MAIELPIEKVNFDGVKADIRKFLNDTTEFQDYNFEGSNLSVLIQILAYNTQLLNYYASMGFNESFLDSAQLRKNIVSIAKHLNYKPKSIQAAKAVLNVTFAGLTDPVIMPIGTKFRTTLNGGMYEFVTVDSYEFTPSEPSLEIDVYEGVMTTFNQVATGSDSIVIHNKNVFDQMIFVSVNGNQWSKADNIVTLDATSDVFFLSEDISGFLRIDFGDDIIGRSPPTGETITVRYMETHGIDANGAKTFTIANSIDGHTPTIATVSPASGGAAEESLEQIKKIAPRVYATQNRTITATDYIAKIMDRYSDIESIAVWGGDEMEPYQPGKVYISIKPISAERLTEAQKRDIIEYLDKFKFMNFGTVIIDPEYTRINLDILVRYDATKLTIPVSALKNSVIVASQNYGDTQLEKFDVYFRESDFTATVDDIHSAITSNQVTSTLEKVIPATIGVRKNYIANFGNPISEVSVEPANIPYSVDLEKGIISIPNYFSVTDTIRVIAKPVEDDIFPSRNMMLTFGSINVRMQSV